MSLDSYDRLDLGLDGPVAADLLSGLAAEGRQSEIALTSPAGAGLDNPAFMTPQMVSWYQRRIAPVRGVAIAEVRQAFEAEALPNGNRGFLREAEADAIERRKLVQVREERETFFQDESVRQLDGEIEKLTTEYERKRAEHGRDAKVWHPVSYGIVLALIALLLEGLVNWESFLKVPGWTPAIATGAFLAVAAAFGTSAHFLGHVLKQWGERFGGNVSARVRNDSWRQLALAAILGLVGFGLVIYSRYFFLREVIDRQILMGDGEVGTTVLVTIGGALFGNLIAYALGVAWAFARHDSVPDFAEERRILDRLRARQRHLHAKRLQPRLTQRLLQASKDLEQLGRRDSDQAQKLRHYGAHRARFDAVRATDARVLALLAEYRNRLAAAGRETERRTRFAFDDPMAGGIAGRVEIEPEAYLGQNLRLPFA
jgi:hypothetical protein